jgi:chitin disaccharide deacetylase
MNNGRKRILITADDYGLCDSVNQAIEECIGAGSVRATCVMANMTAYSAVSTLRKKFPRVSIGIHWNLTQGRPVLSSSQIPTLIDSDGSFLSSSELKRRWWSEQVKQDELKAELRAQFDRVVRLAGPLDFWNTHQNIHVYPGLFQTFVNLGKDLRIPAMRCHRRITVPKGTSGLRYHMTHPQYWLKGQMIAWWSANAEKLGTLMPDGRLYAPGYDEPRTMLEAIISRLPWRKVKKAVEVVIHPATEVQEDLFGSLRESRVIEHQTFRNPGLAEHLRQQGIEPVSFEALTQARTLE